MTIKIEQSNNSYNPETFLEFEKLFKVFQNLLLGLRNCIEQGLSETFLSSTRLLRITSLLTLLMILLAGCANDSPATPLTQNQIDNFNTNGQIDSIPVPTPTLAPHAPTPVPAAQATVAALEAQIRQFNFIAQGLNQFGSDGRPVISEITVQNGDTLAAIIRRFIEEVRESDNPNSATDIGFMKFTPDSQNPNKYIRVAYTEKQSLTLGTAFGELAQLGPLLAQRYPELGLDLNTITTNDSFVVGTTNAIDANRAAQEGTAPLNISVDLQITYHNPGQVPGESVLEITVTDRNAGSRDVLYLYKGELKTWDELPAEARQKMLVSSE